ncbi:DUF3817 domain-containing protein [Streptomyces caeni]|uniref:DUF3817 domain-containing protein n=1 Tax=Streptomyces caeni TaxID=2307231 RepID=A0ABW4IIV2_9ACTN
MSTYSARLFAVLQIFRLVAVAEGTLLPALLVLVLVRYLTGAGASAVAVIGATHGTVFTVYLLLLPLVRRALDWPWRTVGIAFIASLVPLAPWALERQFRTEIRSYAERR